MTRRPVAACGGKPNPRLNVLKVPECGRLIVPSDPDNRTKALPKQRGTYVEISQQCCGSIRMSAFVMAGSSTFAATGADGRVIGYRPVFFFLVRLTRNDAKFES